MAAGQRKTDPGIWNKPWFRQLEPRLKCLWFYLLAECDWAGVWEPDFELATFRIGHGVSEADLSAFGDRVATLPNGKVWLTGFIDFQQPRGVSEANNFGRAIIRSIEKNSVPWQGRGRAGAGQGHEKVFPGAGKKDSGAEKVAAAPQSSSSSSSLSLTSGEGGAGETILAGHVRAVRSARPEFDILSEFAITNELMPHPPAVRAAAVSDFSRDMANALRPPDTPLKLLAGYLRRAAQSAAPETASSIPERTPMEGTR